MVRKAQSISTKENILDKALRLASVSGLDGITIGRLAKAVGMSKSGLFAHFEAKGNLQLMVLKMASERFIENVLTPAFKKPRGEPRIKNLFENWVKYLNDISNYPGGSIFIAASFELDDRPGALRDYVKKVQRDLMDNLAKSAHIAVEEGHFRPDLNVEQFAWSLYSSFLGYHHFKRMLEDPNADSYLRNNFEELLKTSKRK